VKKTILFFASFFAAAAFANPQASHDDGNFKLSLTAHQGQLRWRAAGYHVTQFSAKPNGDEIGLRAADESRKVTFLTFVFTVAGQRSLTSAKCKDSALEELKKSNPNATVSAAPQIHSPNELPIEIVAYTQKNQTGKMLYSVRGFVAMDDICGDLEFYSDSPISPEDPDLHSIFQSLHFDPNYVPQFNDVFMYAQILFQHQMYKGAGPIFEQALAKLKDDKSQQTMRRVTTDQAGMSYGISGDTVKARSIFESAIATDPDYPMYYYNLACADAQENKLADARRHLQQAFQRKANVIPGESLPDPSKDDSFLPYRNDKDFWAFIETLH
jgi:hypothetical protein